MTADVLLLATGRIPNGDGLDLDRTGVALDDDGYVVVDEFQRTTRPGVFALGDVSSHHQLKHVANHEARVVQHNLLHPDAMIAADHRFVPHAVFSSPQVASVGLTEEEAFETGVAYVVGQTEYAATAYGWAMGETGDHLVKLLADPSTGLLLGRPPDRTGCLVADPAADPGDELRAARRRGGARAVLDPSRHGRGGGERAAGPAAGSPVGGMRAGTAESAHPHPRAPASPRRASRRPEPWSAAAWP